MRENEIAQTIVDIALKVHRGLGPGLLETVYEAVMSHELQKVGYDIATQVPVGVEWDDVRIDVAFRADIVVENCVVLELKSVESVLPVHKKQLLTYLRLLKCKLGLLINFNTDLMKNGIARVVNNLPE